MEVTVNNKYQIVIPRFIRDKLDIKTGQKLFIENTKNGDIRISLAPTMKDVLAKYGGVVSGGPWGDDPVKYINNLREDR